MSGDVEKRKEFLDKLGWIKGAPNWKKVLILLDGILTPGEVAKKSGLSMNLASRSLRQMEEKGESAVKPQKERKDASISGQMMENASQENALTEL